MPSATTIFLALSALILALSYSWITEYVTLLGISRPDVKPYEGGKCRKIEGVDACEDLVIHLRTGQAFMACGNGTFRTNVFYPPLGKKKAELPPLIRETPFVYDIINDKLTRLELKNFPPEEDFLLHGLGIFEDEKNEPNKLYVFFINHRRTGSVIEVFEHTLNTKILTHLNTVKHDLIYTPNNIVPVSKDEFYVTNDHYYKDGEIWRMIESLGRFPWTNVVFHSIATNTTEVAAEGLRYANGINTNWDRSKIYVAESFGGDVVIYDRKSNNKLQLSERVFTEMLIDNLNVDDKGEIYVAGTQKAISAFKFLKDTTNPSNSFALAVVKVSNNTDEDKFYGKKYSHKIVFEDNGSIIPVVTVAAVRGKVMLLGSLCREGLGRCDFDEEL